MALGVTSAARADEPALQAPAPQTYAPLSKGLADLAPGAFALNPSLTLGPATGAASSRIRFVTPPIAGFRFGGSYATGSDFDASRLWQGRAPLVSSTSDVALSYSQSLGAVALTSSLTYAKARDASLFGRQDESKALSLGLNLSYGDVTLGGSVGRSDTTTRAGDPVPLLALRPAATRPSFDVGGTYAINDWTLGLSYAYGDTRVPAQLVQSLASRTWPAAGAEFSFDYQIGHSADLISAIQFINFDTTNLPADRAPPKITTNLLLGTRIKF